MADRTVKVIFASDYRGLQQGARAAKAEVAGFARDVGRQAGEAESRVNQFARGVGSASAKAAAAAAAGGVAIGVSLAKVGVQYNALEATSRKAMETILGSAQAASSLMDDLFDFAQTSPFAREVFIQGAQQLAAFGMEAERIIPTLSAIQDSVAAFGGSSAQVGELINTLAKVRSQGKITAITLREFGVRGVDAAQLIGNEMGKTGSQIRADITAGALDADEAIAALTAGMTARFGGAAEGLKEMWGGALQSITARTRNIGSDLAEPFVSARGGGAAVDWANQLAEMLSSLRTSVVPELVPVLERAADAASRVVDSVEDFVDGLDGPRVAGFMAELRPMLPALSGIGAAMAAIGVSSVPVLGAINPVVAALAAMAATSPELRAALVDLGLALADLASAVAPVVGQLATLGSILVSDVAAPVVSALAGALSVLASVLSHLHGPLVAVAVGFVALKAATAGAALIGTLQGLAKALQMVSAAASLQGVSRIGVIGGMMQTSAASAGGFSRMLLGVPGPIAAVGVAAGLVGFALHKMGEKSRETAKAAAELRSEAEATGKSLREVALGKMVETFAKSSKLQSAMSELRLSYRDLGEMTTWSQDRLDRWKKSSLDAERGSRHRIIAVADLTTEIDKQRGKLALATEQDREASRARRELGLGTEDTTAKITGFRGETAQMAHDLTTVEGRLAATGHTLGEWGVVLDESGNAVHEWQGELGKAMDSAAGSVWSFSDEARESLGVLNREAAENLTELSTWRDRLVALAGRVSDVLGPEFVTPVITEWANLGPEYSAVLAELVMASDDKLAENALLFTAAGEEATRNLVEEVESAAGLIPSAIDPVRDALARELDAMGRSIEGEAASVGASIGAGITTGLSGTKSRVMATARNIAESALAAAREAAEVGSPSRRFDREVGRPIGEGIAVGILRSIPVGRAAMARYTGEMVRAAEQLANDLARSTREAVDRAWSGVRDRFATADARQAVDDAQRGLADARSQVRVAQRELVAARDARLTVAARIAVAEGALAAARQAGDVDAVANAEWDLLRLRREDAAAVEDVTDAQQSLADARRAVADAEDRLRSASRRLLETQTELVAQGRAGEDQFRRLATQAGLTRREVDDLVDAYRRLNAAQRLAAPVQGHAGERSRVASAIRAIFAERGVDPATGGRPGESGQQRLDRLAQDVMAGRSVGDIARAVDQIARMQAQIRWAYGSRGITESDAHIAQLTTDILQGRQTLNNVLTWIGALPRMDVGGRVAGPVGSAQLIVAHAGETVVPTHRSDWMTSPAAGSLGVLGGSGRAGTAVLDELKALRQAVADMRGINLNLGTATDASVGPIVRRAMREVQFAQDATRGFGT